MRRTVATLRLGVVTADNEFRRTLERQLGQRDRIRLIPNRERGPLADIANCVSFSPDALILDAADVECREAADAVRSLYPDLAAIYVVRPLPDDLAEGVEGRGARLPMSTRARVVEWASTTVEPQLVNLILDKVTEVLSEKGITLEDGRPPQSVLEEATPRPASGSDVEVSEPKFRSPQHPKTAKSAAKAPLRPAEPVGDPQSCRSLSGRFDVVGIGISTGGPRVLPELLAQLPQSFPLPVCIVQHMPAGFTKSLAETLSRSTELRVVEAEMDMPIEAGSVYIAAGGLHLAVERGANGTVYAKLNSEPPERCCRPSADHLFRSLVKAYGSRVLGVVMTGMGDDGTAGCGNIVDAGGRVLAQSEESCTVFGMPRAPIEQGLATAVLNPTDLGREIAALGRRRR